MKKLTGEQEEWQAELEAAEKDTDTHAEWQKEMQEFFNKNPIKPGTVTTYGPKEVGSYGSGYSMDYYHQSSRQDLTRWRTGSSTYSYFSSGFNSSGDNRDLSILVSDAVIRTANAVTNKPVNIKGEEKFLSLRIGGHPTEEGALVNTALTPTVHLTTAWMNDGRSNIDMRNPEKANETINELCNAYTGQALVLATSKKTMKEGVAKKADMMMKQISVGRQTNRQQLVKLSQEEKHAELARAVALEPSLILWRQAEFNAAEKELLKDWPGFSDYVAKAKERQAPHLGLQRVADQVADIIPAITELIEEQEAKLAPLEKRHEELGLTLPIPEAHMRVGLKNSISSLEIKRLELASNLTASAVSYVASGATEKVKLPDYIIEGASHAIEKKKARVNPKGTLLDQAKEIAADIVSFHHQRWDIPDDPENKGDGDGEDEGDGEGGGEGDKGKGKSPPKPEQFDPSGEPDKNGNPLVEVDFNDILNGDAISASSNPQGSSRGRDDGIVADMNPESIDYDPSKLGGNITNDYGVIRGFLLSGMPKPCSAQIEFIRQMSEPISKVVKNKVSFRATSPSFEVVGLRKGDIDEANLPFAGHDPKVFSRKEEKSRPALVVGLLLDQSGSMMSGTSSTFQPNMDRIHDLLLKSHPKFKSGGPRPLTLPAHGGVITMDDPMVSNFGVTSSYAINQRTKAISCSLSKSDQVAGVAAGIVNGIIGFPGLETYVAGFYSSSSRKPFTGKREPGPLKQFVTNDKQTLELYEYVSRSAGKMDSKKVLERLAMVHAGHANSDGFAIMHVAARMKELYPDIRNRVLFVLSDGQPSSNAFCYERNGGVLRVVGERSDEYEGLTAMRHIRSVCNWASTHQQVRVLGIGVANAYTIIDGRIMYGENNFTVLKDVEGAAGIIAAFLSRAFHKLGV